MEWYRPCRKSVCKSFALIGIPVAAGIINFVVLTAAASSCNSGIFSTSRMTYTLANDGQAPKQLKGLNNRSIPAPALIFSTLVLLIGVLMNYLLPDQVFTLVTGIATICFIWVWGIVLFSHIRFRKMMAEEAKKIHSKCLLRPL